MAETGFFLPGMIAGKAAGTLPLDGKLTWLLREKDFWLIAF